MRKPALLFALAALAGCARPGTSPSPAASTSPAAQPLAASAPADSAAEAPPLPPPGPWRDAVRDQRWGEAKSLLEALGEDEQRRPEMRLVRAKVARMLGDHRAVLALTDRLDLRLAAEVVARFRAEAALEVGPHDEAAAYYQGKAGPRAALKAGLALERAGKLDEARRQLDRAVAAARGESQEAAARTARARVAAALGQKSDAAADARWVFLKTPAQGKEAAGILEKSDASWKPSAAERLDRASKLAQAGQGPEALAEVDAAAQGPGAPSADAMLHERGMVLYKLRRYAEAADLLGQAAQRSRSGDDVFQAARALSRAHKDAEAIKGYQGLIQADARGPHAEEASYLIARLQLLLGRSDEAERSYNSYLKRHRKGKFHGAAVYELGLAQLAAGHHGKARATFGTLARNEESKAEAARLRELEGVAALKGGDEAGARQAFSEVIRDQPLSWPALMAQARLAQLGEQAPQRLEPSPDGARSAALSVRLPPAAGFLHQLGLEEEAEEALKAEEKSVEAAAGGRGAEALCEAYGQLDLASRRYRVGQDKARLDLVMREPGFANRWAWECLYPAPYAEIVRGAEAREGLPPGLVHAVMRQESGFDPAAVSPALAEGLLQLLPTTARELARRNSVPFEEGSLGRPAVNIDLGARYLSMLLRMWKGSLPLAVASYNAGPGAVSRWLEHAGPIEADVWVARIPYGETRTYVGRVLGNLARYGYLAGGQEKLPRLPLAIDASLKAEEGAF